jgi:hypothetical protein
VQSPDWEAAVSVHEIPVAETVPVPVLDPAAATVTKYLGGGGGGGGGAKLALTFVFWPMVSVHVGVVPRAAHAPPQPAKLPPLEAAAVSVTCVPELNVSLQSPLADDDAIAQLMPVPLTAPVPAPPPAAMVTV